MEVHLFILCICCVLCFRVSVCGCMWLYGTQMTRMNMHMYVFLRGRLGGCMGGCECKLNANILVVDWNGTERCCVAAAVGVRVGVWVCGWRWL